MKKSEKIRQMMISLGIDYIKGTSSHTLDKVWHTLTNAVGYAVVGNNPTERVQAQARLDTWNNFIKTL